MVAAMEKLSVIIPAYNAENTWHKPWRPYGRRDWPGGVEVVIADDGSVDRTLTIAEELGEIVLTQFDKKFHDIISIWIYCWDHSERSVPCIDMVSGHLVPYERRRKTNERYT